MATSFSFIPYKVNDEIHVSVFLTSLHIPINTVEGTIIFSTSTLQFKRSIDAGSPISVWLQRPTYSSGTIAFAGSIPGGIQTKGVPVMTLVFTQLREGDAKITMDNTRVLAHDGFGTEQKISISPLSFETNQVMQKKEKVVDIDPPEEFSVDVVSEKAFGISERIVVFATQDKGSGVREFKVREGFFGTETTAEGMYSLQSPFTWIVFVKAIDHDGNFRVQKTIDVPPILWVIILFGFMLLLAGILWLKKASR